VERSSESRPAQAGHAIPLVAADLAQVERVGRMTALASERAPVLAGPLTW